MIFKRYFQHSQRKLTTLEKKCLFLMIGSVLLAIVALGLMAYGAYSLVEARYRRIAGRQLSVKTLLTIRIRLEEKIDWAEQQATCPERDTHVAVGLWLLTGGRTRSILADTSCRLCYCICCITLQ